MRIKVLAVLVAAIATTTAAAGEPPAQLVIRDHKFTPTVLEVPAGQVVKLEVVNADPTGEEFESGALHVEREIAPHGKLILQIGPLQPGDYPFVGDLHADTAKGTLHVVSSRAP